MSVESQVIAELVSEGSPKKLLLAGLGREAFELHDDEIDWILNRYENRKPINARTFKKRFPEFDFVSTGERLPDLIEELRQERAFVAISSALDEISEGLDHENAIEKASELKEILQDVIRSHSPVSDVLVKSEWREHYSQMRNLSLLTKNGEPPGIPTGLPHLDFHLGGWQGGNMYLVLGRPGDAKSYFLANAAVQGKLDGRRIGMFSPEMNKFQHNCRIHTLLSANEKIKQELGLEKSFRNRALMDGHGFNIKEYKKFLEYVETKVPGEIVLFTNRFRRGKMSVSYIEGRVDELGLDMVVVDPIYKLKAQRRQLKHEEIADITDQLQDLAQMRDIPVIVSNQAHRQGNNPNKAPDKDQSFGSDAPVQEATFVMGVRYFEDENTMQIRCTKSRFGSAFKFDVRFNPNTGYMEDVTPIHGNYYNGRDDEFKHKAQKALEGK